MQCRLWISFWRAVEAKHENRLSADVRTVDFRGARWAEILGLTESPSARNPCAGDRQTARDVAMPSAGIGNRLSERE